MKVSKKTQLPLANLLAVLNAARAIRSKREEVHSLGYSTKDSLLSRPYTVLQALGVRAFLVHFLRATQSDIRVHTVGVGSIILTAATYGGVILRIFLGEEAFSIYYGDSIHEWVFHCLDFAFVPTTLLLSDTFLFDAIIPVSEGATNFHLNANFEDNRSPFLSFSFPQISLQHVLQMTGAHLDASVG